LILFNDPKINQEVRRNCTMSELSIFTKDEGMNDFTSDIKKWINENLNSKQNGVLHIFLKHTSAALTISESYERSAKDDMEAFLKHLAPRNLAFIQHTTEGPDDSPSHMKSILLNPSLTLIIKNGEMVLGTWQGLYLAEFRDGTHERKIVLSFISSQ
jgi:secondary thiamine-phosphate synthase enzyme